MKFIVETIADVPSPEIWANTTASAQENGGCNSPHICSLGDFRGDVGKGGVGWLMPWDSFQLAKDRCGRSSRWFLWNRSGSRRWFKGVIWVDRVSCSSHLLNHHGIILTLNVPCVCMNQNKRCDCGPIMIASLINSFNIQILYIDLDSKFGCANLNCQQRCMGPGNLCWMRMDVSS